MDFDDIIRGVFGEDGEAAGSCSLPEWLTTPRTLETLADDIFAYCDLDSRGMVNLQLVQSRMRSTFDSPSRERIVAAIEQLEHDGRVQCLFNRAGEMMGYVMVGHDRDRP